MNSLEAPQPAVQPVGYYLRFIVLFASMFTLLAGGAIAPALPGMRAHFASTPNVDTLIRMQLSLAALFIAVGAPLAGLLIDKLGRQQVLATAILMTATFGAAGYWADSLTTLLATRVLLGIGVGGVITAATTLVGDVFEGAARTRFVSLQASMIKVGGILFTLIGGVLASINWRAVFLVDLLALLILPGVFTHVPSWRPPPSERHLEERAVSRLPAQATAVVLATALLGQVFLYMVPTQVPFLLTKVYQSSPASVSYIISASMLAMAVSASQYHRLRRYLGYYSIVGVSFLVAGIGYVATMYCDQAWTAVLALVVAGLGFGFIVANTTSWVLAISPEPLRGRATGLLMMASFLGQFLSPLFFAQTLARSGIRHLFGFAGTLLVALAAVFFIASLVQRKRS